MTVFNLASKSACTHFLGVGPRATKVAIILTVVFIDLFHGIYVTAELIPIIKTYCITASIVSKINIYVEV